MRVSQYTGEPSDAGRVLPHILGKGEMGGVARILTPPPHFFFPAAGCSSTPSR